jgi:hypothetical protein
MAREAMGDDRFAISFASPAAQAEKCRRWKASIHRRDTSAALVVPTLMMDNVLKLL